MIKMICDEILFSDHAITQMFRRDISVNDIKQVLANGEIIATYLTDKPYPSYLLLDYIINRPIHIVVANDHELSKCIIITAYEPDVNIWEADFKKKR